MQPQQIDQQTQPQQPNQSNPLCTAEILYQEHKFNEAQALTDEILLSIMLPDKDQ